MSQNTDVAVKEDSEESVGDARLEMTQQVREELLSKLLDDKKDYDKDRIDLILKTTKDMDSQEIGKKRIAASNKDSDSSIAIAKALERMIQAEESGQVPVHRPKIVRDPGRLNTDFLGEPDQARIESGALDDNTTQETYEEFIERMDKKEPVIIDHKDL